MRISNSSVAAALATFALAALSLAAGQQPAQNKSQRPSPPGSTECSIKGKKVSISYSRPSMKGRKIMGDLVPYDQLPEDKKEYDRDTAMETIKAILALGYTILKPRKPGKE